jgi:hypothetical protein
MIILRRTLLLLAEAFPVASPPPPVRSEALGVVPVTSFSSELIEAIKAIMMAFLSIASLRAACMAVLSASEQVPIVKVGVLHLVMISTDAGLLEMVVVQVVMVVVMVEHSCCCLLPRSRAWWESKIYQDNYYFIETFSSYCFLLTLLRAPCCSCGVCSIRPHLGRQASQLLDFIHEFSKCC